VSFSLSGLASGIDTNTLIEQLMQIERQPVVRLENRKKSLASEQSFFRSLNTKLRTLQEAAADLTLSGTFRAMKAESSDKTVLGVKSQGTAVPGTYEITVHSLAKSHVVQSAERNADAEIGVSGTFYIHHESLESPLAIEVTGATYGEVMDEIVSQINSQSVGVKASVIETSNGNKRLILTAEHAGADHRIKMGEGVEGSAVVFEDTDGILSALGITSDADGEIAEQNVARPYTDAVISVNGVQVTRSSNTIDDVIPGRDAPVAKRRSRQCDCRFGHRGDHRGD
jgi:flagellar hook-associated protein 2